MKKVITFLTVELLLVINNDNSFFFICGLIILTSLIGISISIENIKIINIIKNFFVSTILGIIILISFYGLQIDMKLRWWILLFVFLIAMDSYILYNLSTKLVNYLISKIIKN